MPPMGLLLQQIWNGTIKGVGYVLFAMGLNLIFGVLGVVNMAQGEFFMLGAMLLWAVMSFLGVNFFYAMLLSIAIVALIGIVINQIAVKPLINDPLSVLLSTMAISSIFISGATIGWGSDARVITTPIEGTVSIGGASIPNASLMLCFIGVAALIGVYFLLKTRIGKAIRATAQDRVGASLVGINIFWVHAVTMIVASALGALAGGIVGSIWVAYPGMGRMMLLKGFAIVVTAGMGNLEACAIVGLVIGVTEALFSQYVSMYYTDAYAFGILVLVCLLRPQGLFARTS